MLQIKEKIQSQKNTLPEWIKHPTTWWETFNKKRENQDYSHLVFKALEHLTYGSLTVVDGDNKRQFGDINSELQGQITIQDRSFYRDVVFKGSIGAAEAYIEKKWDSDDLTKIIEIMARNQHKLDEIDKKIHWFSKVEGWIEQWKTRNTEDTAKQNILSHYDISDDFYQAFLDKEMMYSCAWYPTKEADLDTAQHYKMMQICHKLDLQPEDHVLEIGSGWGAMAIFMAKNFGCKVTTTTISDAQYQWAKARIEQEGLQEQITLTNLDYRRLEGQFDKLVSIEMVEAVGDAYFGKFFAQCNNLLKPDGKMLIQAITINDHRYKRYKKNTDFIRKYVFPGGCLPSVAVMSKHIAKKTDMVIEDLEDVGVHYARTLNDWRIRLDKAWEQLSDPMYTEEFKRLWQYYFAYCEGGFRQRVISVHQMVARKPMKFSEQEKEILSYNQVAPEVKQPEVKVKKTKKVKTKKEGQKKEGHKAA